MNPYYQQDMSPTVAQQPPPMMPNIPMESMGMSPPSNDAGMAAMRWESYQLAWELCKNIGGFVPKLNPDGSWDLIKVNPNIKTKINEVGMRSLVSFLQGMVNPHTSLTNISDDEANELFSIAMYALIRDLSYNCSQYEINDGDLNSIFYTLVPIAFSQVKRAVGGFEGNTFKTQTLEHNVQQNVHQTGGGGGFSFLPFGRKNRY